MSAYTPTLVGKDGENILLAATNGDVSYLGNKWTADAWVFAAGERPQVKTAAAVPSVVSEIVFSEWASTTVSMNGAVLTEASMLLAGTYTGNTWVTGNWNLADGVLPEVKVVPAVITTTGPIDYNPWRVNEILMNGNEVLSANTLGGTQYLSTAWTATAWNFADGVLPEVKVTPAVVTTTGPIDYQPWRVNEILMNGDEVLAADTLAETHYLANKWTIVGWNFTTGQIPVPKAAEPQPSALSDIIFTDWLRQTGSKEGGTITFEESKMARTYTYNTWRFDRYWHILEGSSFPILITEIPIIEPGRALRSEKKFVFLEPSESGDLIIGNVLYKQTKNPIVADIVEGSVGETVVHGFGGLKIKPTNTVGSMSAMSTFAAMAEPEPTYVFEASAVEDTTALGGYGEFTNETERTVALRSDAGANVNFYYVVEPPPVYDYLLNMKLAGLPFHIALFKNNVTDLRMKMVDGTTAHVGIVPVNAEDASNIRIMTKDGVRALQKVVI